MTKRKKLGLALGGGGARGLAHIGVIKVLLEEKIPIDLIAGTSMGAMVGGLYAALGDIEKVEKIAVDFTVKDWVSTFVDRVGGMGLIKGERAENKIRAIVGDVAIEKLSIPFGAVATDINTAEKVVIDRGDLAKGIRASCSVPLLFEPVVMEGRTLVDGGTSCPVPVEIVKEMGADVIVAVNLDSVYFLPENQRKTKISTLDVMRNTLFLLKYHLAEKEIREADVVINPAIPYVGDLDFVNKKSLITGGEFAARKAIELIRPLLV